ncbi:hypothetical protein V8F33_011437 [Rhypophila sp. PSN 637]
MVDHGGASGGSGGDWATPKTGQPKSTATYGYSSATTSTGYTYPAPAPPPPEPTLNKEELEYWHYAVELSGRINQGRDVIYNHFLTELTNQGGRSNIPPYVWTGQCCRVMSLDFASGSFVEHDDFPGLRRKISPMNPRAPKLPPFFVSEDYNREQICVLGHNHGIPFFADHLTTDEGTVHMDTIRSFPTIESGQEAADPSQDTQVIIRYPVIAPNGARGNHPRHSGHALTGQSTYAASVVERQIETPSQYDEWDHEGLVITASAQLSYWIRGKRKTGEGSTVLLVDPPISKLVPDESWRNLVRLAEFEDPKGRVPVAATQPSTTTTAPTHLYTNTCLYADIQLFISQTQPTPEQVLAFARRFALNNWIALINHARACLNKLRSKLYSGGIKSSSVRQHFKHANHSSIADYSYSPNYSGGPFAEWILERLADWSTSLAFYMMDVEANMLALGIDPDNESSHGQVGKKEAQQWRYIRHTLGVYRDLYRQTADSYTQVTALREAQQVGKLTRLGVLFLPAGFVAGLLSMGGDFLPGQSQFWVFWAVALPVVGIVWTVLGMEGSLRERLKGFGNRL